MFDMIANTKYYFGKDENKTEKSWHLLTCGIIFICVYTFFNQKKKRKKEKDMKRMKDGSFFSIVPCVWIINNIHHFFYCKNDKKPKYLKRYLN